MHAVKNQPHLIDVYEPAVYVPDVQIPVPHSVARQVYRDRFWGIHPRDVRAA